jgi:ribosomal protein S18 acetylase RimI-like enzyme
MDVVDRLMRPDDLEAALDLWGDAFGLSHALLLEEFTLRDPRRFAHTRVAVAGDGRLVATASYSVREVRDAAGRPERVGAVANVATHRAARRQGHARRLLAATTAAMRREGCRWALLFTTADGRPLYDRAGWRTLPRPYRRGTLSGAGVHAPAEYAVRRHGPNGAAGDWSHVATVYGAYNATRSLTVVRDRAYWEGYAAMRFATSQAGERATVVVATPRSAAGPLCGYALAYAPAGQASASPGSGAFSIAEIGVLPGHEAAIPALLAAAASTAGAPGSTGHVYLPREPAVDAALAGIFGGTLSASEDHKMMVLPLTPDGDPGALAALAALPGAIYWPLDEV